MQNIHGINLWKPTKWSKSVIDGYHHDSWRRQGGSLKHGPHSVKIGASMNEKEDGKLLILVMSLRKK